MGVTVRLRGRPADRPRLQRQGLGHPNQRQAEAPSPLDHHPNRRQERPPPLQRLLSGRSQVVAVRRSPPSQMVEGEMLPLLVPPRMAGARPGAPALIGRRSMAGLTAKLRSADGSWVSSSPRSTPRRSERASSTKQPKSNRWRGRLWRASCRPRWSGPKVGKRAAKQQAQREEEARLFHQAGEILVAAGQRNFLLNFARALVDEHLSPTSIYAKRLSDGSRNILVRMHLRRVCTHIPACKRMHEHVTRLPDADPLRAPLLSSCRCR